jgi:phosphomannomutase
MADVAAIFKAYDVRGIVPDEFDESVARPSSR